MQRVELQYGVNRGQTCCKDCQDRVVGCHSSCEKYLAQREKWDKIIDARTKELKRIKDVLIVTKYEWRTK